jgi:hypothetical protein
MTSSSTGDLSDVLAACNRKNIQLTISDQLHYAEQLARGIGFINSKGLSRHLFGFL